MSSSTRASSYGFGGVESLLGAADNPDDALIALYHGGLSSGAVLGLAPSA